MEEPWKFSFLSDKDGDDNDNDMFSSIEYMMIVHDRYNQPGHC